MPETSPDDQSARVAGGDHADVLADDLASTFAHHLASALAAALVLAGATDALQGKRGAARVGPSAARLLAAAGLLPAALLARLGVPALAALVFLAVLVLGVACWIIDSGDRSDRVTRMILARRGDARCLAPGPSARLCPSRQPLSARSAARDTARAGAPSPANPGL
jgi:hypothetical protein